MHHCRRRNRAAHCRAISNENRKLCCSGAHRLRGCMRTPITKSHDVSGIHDQTSFQLAEGKISSAMLRIWLHLHLLLLFLRDQDPLKLRVKPTNEFELHRPEAAWKAMVDGTFFSYHESLPLLTWIIPGFDGCRSETPRSDCSSRPAEIGRHCQRPT
jgi:hypothetical protein